MYFYKTIYHSGKMVHIFAQDLDFQLAILVANHLLNLNELQQIHQSEENKIK